jgi:hypothetical protein
MATGPGIRGDSGLKVTVLLVIQQRGNLPGKNGGLNQLHSSKLSANGV